MTDAQAKKIAERYAAPLAVNLRRLLKEHKMTQMQLAEEIGVSQASVYQYTNGVSEPSCETLLNIALTFGVTVDMLLRFDVPDDLESAARMMNIEKHTIMAIAGTRDHRERAFFFATLLNEELAEL